MCEFVVSCFFRVQLVYLYFMFVFCCHLLFWHRHVIASNHRRHSDGAKAGRRFSVKGTPPVNNNILLTIWRIKHTGFWNVLWGIRREDSPDEEGLGVPTRCSHTPVLVANTVMRWLSPRLSHWLSPSSTVRNYVASIMSVYFPWIPRHDAISTT